ncbi:hypothetical protein B0H17DRAFT_1123855 [Mycena rosella]|uniref:Uncharacterized protein n=1 Tax=Mycena rosella TaxID=1033263 RepID=A0AAD7H366_MYCRO|nr:hypothetical protein B0H17DRAFT_1123855 [Mycena rosella]
MSHLSIKSSSPSPPSFSPGSREPRPLFNGGALDSQVTDSQFVETLVQQHRPASENSGSPLPIFNDGSSANGDASFGSTGSDTACSEHVIWASAHSQDEPSPLIEEKPFMRISEDEPMDDCFNYSSYSHSSRPSTPDFIADLKAEDIRLSVTEVRVIAAMRADRDSELRQYGKQEEEWWCDMSKTHNQSTRIAALESLLEYHRILLLA